MVDAWCRISLRCKHVKQRRCTAGCWVHGLLWILQKPGVTWKFHRIRRHTENTQAGRHNTSAGCMDGKSTSFSPLFWGFLSCSYLSPLQGKLWHVETTDIQNHWTPLSEENIQLWVGEVMSFSLQERICPKFTRSKLYEPAASKTILPKLLKAFFAPSFTEILSCGNCEVKRTSIRWN